MKAAVIMIEELPNVKAQRGAGRPLRVFNERVVRISDNSDCDGPVNNTSATTEAIA